MGEFSRETHDARGLRSLVKRLVAEPFDAPALRLFKCADRVGARGPQRFPRRGGRRGLGLARFSIALSRRLARTRITPNQITAASLAVGLAGAALVASADYATCLLGTLIVWLSSILDGCDGEIARLKLLSSEAGRWFDLLVEKSQEPGYRPFGDTACLRLVQRTRRALERGAYHH
jgi:CDP-alcohol phosphatidyltransferase